MTGARPRYTVAEAIERARKLIGAGTYKLGALDSEVDDLVFDCTSFCLRHAFGLDGHRPGYNRDWKVDWCTGTTSSVVDDLNSNSAIEDAFHGRELFELVVGPPLPGDIIAAPTIRLGESIVGPWIGHAAIVSNVDRAKHKWDPMRPQFALLDVIECRGPDGRHPAIRQSNGTWFDERSLTWPKVNHRAWLLRVRTVEA